MPRLGLGMRMLVRCGSGWQTAGPRVTPLGGSSAISCHSMRPASTASLKKGQTVTKAAKGSTVETSPKEKKSKTTTAESAPAKKTKKKAAAASTQTDAPAATAAKKLAEPPTKPLPLDPLKKAKVTKNKKSAVAGEQPKGAAAMVTEAKEAAATKPTQMKAKAPASAANPSAPLNWPRTAPSVGPTTGIVRPTIPATPSRVAPPGPTRSKIDEEKLARITSSPEYKKAKKRWVSVMVALPLFLVTSYFLYDRLITEFLLGRISPEGPMERLRKARESIATEKGGAEGI